MCPNSVPVQALICALLKALKAFKAFKNVVLIHCFVLYLFIFLARFSKRKLVLLQDT